MWIERDAASGWRRATCNEQCAQPHVELLHARSHEQVENCVTQLLQTGFVLFTQFRNGLPVLLPCASPQPRLASSRPGKTCTGDGALCRFPRPAL